MAYPHEDRSGRTVYVTVREPSLEKAVAERDAYLRNFAPQAYGTFFQEPQTTPDGQVVIAGARFFTC